MKATMSPHIYQYIVYIDSTSLRNCTGGMHIIPSNILLSGVLIMVMESTCQSKISSRCSIRLIFGNCEGQRSNDLPHFHHH